jgi:hypothetical protein
MRSTSSAGSLGSLMNQANQVLSDSDEECIVHEYMNANNDEWLDSFDEIDLEYVRSQRGRRQGRRVLTWLFSGDILECMEDTHPIPSKRWSSLPQDVQDANWISFCRCRRPVFEELLATVGPHIPDAQAVIPSHRTYSRQQKLLITLYFLAHCPSMRCMQRTFGVPQNTISQRILRPTLCALDQVLRVNSETKVIRFLRTVDAINSTARQFQTKFGLPAVLGALDGSLIPQKKPSAAQAGNDADAYWSYKGHVASLLLAICDANGHFLYINAGSPGTVGDAGLWGRSDLWKQIQEGLLDGTALNLVAGGVAQNIQAYFVADSAFPLGKHVMKIYGDPRGAQERAEFEATGKAKFNRCVINARRLIEQVFGGLKGRWLMCARNMFFQEPEFVKLCICVCCALHNFFEMRNVEFDEDQLQAAEAALNMEGAPAAAAVGGQAVGAQQGPAARIAEGEVVRQFLRAWSHALFVATNTSLVYNPR